MWGAISTLLTRAGEALGIEVPEIPGVTEIGDAASAATDAVAGQADAVSTDVAGAATDLATGASDTVTGVVEQATAAAASLPDLVQGKTN